MSSEGNDDDLIIDNWVIFPNGYIAGTAYENVKELQETPNMDKKNKYTWSFQQQVCAFKCH